MLADLVVWESKLLYYEARAGCILNTAVLVIQFTLQPYKQLFGETACEEVNKRLEMSLDSVVHASTCAYIDL